jgi:endo-alpha-1,4-polygalactosaminidase (GH114 family)
MYDIDLQDAVPRRTVSHFRLNGHRRTVTWAAGDNAGVIAQLHRANKIVICYLDSGAAERYRPDWQLFPRSVRLNNTGWRGEYWLDIRHRNWPHFAPIIWARFALAARIGCDGVEPDENNPVGNVPHSAGITLANEKRWYLKVAAEAHHDGLSVGMKNGIERAVTDADTVHAFDWDLNEECFYFRECGALKQFINAGKSVFQTEYAVDWRHREDRYKHPRALRQTVCAIARRHSFTHRFSILVKRKVPDRSFVSG